MAKENEKAEAIRLRRRGKTYSEILAVVHVAKSTLAIWFTEAHLAKSQEQRITELRRITQKKGAQARRDGRTSEVEHFLLRGIRDVGTLSSRELWLIGIALHWAEGSKQSARVPSQGIIFNNSDPKMLRVFIEWLKGLGISEENMLFSLYVHIDRQNDIDN